MSDERPDDRYLWDRSGPPDPEIVRLEQLLAPLGHQDRAPAVPSIQSRRTVLTAIRWRPLLAAAAVVVVAAGGWFAYTATLRGWAVQSMAGRPVVDGVALPDGGTTGQGARLRVGKWLTTDATSRARISDEQIGRVDVDPNTRVQLVEARNREHRMSLVRGTIHAQIWAPPKFFYVDTPSAVAVDLGCAYTLQVDDDGAGLVRVTLGWVGFESGGRESFIPEGAVCATRPGVGPGTPRYDDAPAGYGEALALLDFEQAGESQRRAALELILSRARRRDALTLWHLLSRGSAEERALVCQTMTTLAPPPPGVTCAAVLGGDRGARDQWWDTLGLESTTWWRLWKQKW